MSVVALGFSWGEWNRDGMGRCSRIHQRSASFELYAPSRRRFFLSVLRSLDPAESKGCSWAHSHPLPHWHFLNRCAPGHLPSVSKSAVIPVSKPEFRE